MTMPRRLEKYYAASKRRLVRGAERVVTANVEPFDRLSRLTPMAVTYTIPRYLFNTADKVMSPEICATGTYDEQELDWALGYLGHPQRHRLVLDVGANIGTTTIPLITRYGASAVAAFEPDPFNFKLLRCNLILNDLEGLVTAKQVAISDQECDLRLELCGWNSGDSRIQAVNTQWEEMSESARPTVKVHALPLDQAIDASAEDISLVWVDVQGHEAHVLAGAPSLLRLRAPWVIEYWPYALTRAGGLERLHRLIEDNFSGVVDIRNSLKHDKPVVLTAGQVDTLPQHETHWYTDLILLP